METELRMALRIRFCLHRDVRLLRFFGQAGTFQCKGYLVSQDFKEMQLLRIQNASRGLDGPPTRRWVPLIQQWQIQGTARQCFAAQACPLAMLEDPLRHSRFFWIEFEEHLLAR